MRLFASRKAKQLLPRTTLNHATSTMKKTTTMAMRAKFTLIAAVPLAGCATHGNRFHRRQTAGRLQQHSALNRAPFLLRCRSRRVTNNTCSRVRHSVFPGARRHSSGRSNLLAKRVAFALAKLPPTAWLSNNQDVNSSTRGVVTPIFCRANFRCRARRARFRAR